MFESPMQIHLLENPFVWLLATVILVVVVEAITELIVQAEIFTPIRAWISRQSDWLSYLVTCGYCTSVWIAGLAALVSPPITNVWFIDVPIMLYFLHRMSNIVHEGFSRWLGRHPWTVVHHHVGNGSRKGKKQ